MLRTFLSIVKSFSARQFAVFIIASACALLSGILLILQLIDTYTVALPADGGTFNEGVVGQVAYINPILARDSSVDRDVTSLLFASVSGLAEEISHDDSFQLWNMRIKENAQWDDGSPITSDDIIFTVQLIQNADAASPLSGTWQHVTAKRISEREVQFETIHAYALFPNLLQELRPLPKKYFADLSPANIRLSAFNLKPTGSGPFKFEEIKKRNDGFITDIILTRNERFETIGTLPHLNTFHFHYFENEEALIASFNKGQLDGIGTLNPLVSDEIRLHATKEKIPTSRYYALFFNPNGNSVLASKNVRRALDMYIRKDEVVRKAFGDNAQIQKGPLPMYEDFSSQNNQPENGNKEEAASLLTAEGWTFDEGTRSWIRLSGGVSQKLEFTIRIPDSSLVTSLATAIAEQWEQEGIHASIKKTDANTFSEEVLKTRDYEMIVYGNILLENPDLTSFWHSNERFHPGLNFSLLQSPAVDTILSELKSLPIRSDIRHARLNEFARTILGEAPASFIASPYYLYITRSSSVGAPISHIATPDDRFVQIQDWHVKTKRVRR